MQQPPRTQGGFRQYGESDFETLGFIPRVQGLGFTLSEIRNLLDLRGNRLRPCAPVRRRLEEKLVDVRQNGAKTAVLLGGPSKPGLYIVLVKWTPHHMSHPHWHPNNRFTTVLSGPWWIGTGMKFDPDSTVPLPAGSFVTHFGKQVHYDGAKDEEAVLQIVSEGPATATPTEAK